VREGRDGAEGLLRPPDETILTRTIAVVAALAVLTASCATTELAGSRASPARSGVDAAGSGVDAARSGAVPAPPAPARNTAAIDDPVERARFACAVEVQRAQKFDPGRSLYEGTLIGAAVGGALGAGLGALFGLIGDIPGRGAAAGAIAGGGTGMLFGGLWRLEADTAAYERGLAACLTVRTVAPTSVAPGLVEYRLRTLSLWSDAFTSFLSSAELMDGAAGPGLTRLASVADAGTLGRGTVLYDRHITAVPPSMLAAFDAVAVDAQIKLGGAGKDFWDEARWYGKPGERSVWMITARNRRPQEVRRVGLSDTTAIAQFRPMGRPLFAATPQATVAVPIAFLQAADGRGARSQHVVGGLDPGRAIGAVVARNDILFPDRVYLVITHAARPATYEALLGWGERAVERGEFAPRDP
jgi:hypothetical protein